MARSNWIGQTLDGRYEIQELLGKGGMSSVYKAIDPNLRRAVAVKLIHQHLSDDPSFVRRFEEEAAAVAQLRHPNLIQVYDFNNDDGTYYIIFEYVPGETLEGRLKRLKQGNRLMEIDEVTEIMARSAEGLQYAHSRGLIHRDIKPANIMINVQGSPIIMDFGIAKIMGSTQHTATGAVLGTARYMSPEQIKGETVDSRTDIYSLGVTLFSMLAARPPFESDSAMSMMIMHMSDPAPDLNAIRPDISPELAALTAKSLAKEPADRFQTGSEFAAALRNLPKHTAAAPAASTVVYTTPQPVAPQEAATPTGAISHTPAASMAAAAPAAVSGVTETPAAPTPTTSQPAPAATAGSSRSLLYGVGAAILLLLLAVSVWAVFFRDTGNEDAVAGSVAVPATATPEPEATPDLAATKAAADADMEAQLETRVVIAKLQTAEANAGAAPTTPEATANYETPYSVEITRITLENGTYNVFYLTSGFTEELPGRHVHFYFDTVPEIQAGAQGGDGSGWVRYGGPRPFSGYSEADRPAGAVSMCARAANDNHTIILASGNCYPLP